jgi:hypothetical protein
MRSGKRDEAVTSLRRALPSSYTPWSHFQAARTNRLLQSLGDPDAPDGSETLRRSGRRDKWPFMEYDFAFNELWCWE